jgi:hypothetical protein
MMPRQISLPRRRSVATFTVSLIVLCWLTGVLFASISSGTLLSSAAPMLQARSSPAATGESFWALYGLGLQFGTH